MLQAILEAGYRPEIVIVEINSQIGAEHCLTIPPASVVGRPFLLPGAVSSQRIFRPLFILRCVSTVSRCRSGEQINFGATVPAFAALASQHGYTLVYCESVGVNCYSKRPPPPPAFALLPVHIADLRANCCDGSGAE